MSSRNKQPVILPSEEKLRDVSTGLPHLRKRVFKLCGIWNRNHGAELLRCQRQRELLFIVGERVLDVPVANQVSVLILDGVAAESMLCNCLLQRGRGGVGRKCYKLSKWVGDIANYFFREFKCVGDGCRGVLEGAVFPRFSDNVLDLIEGECGICLISWLKAKYPQDAI